MESKNEMGRNSVVMMGGLSVPALNMHYAKQESYKKVIIKVHDDDDGKKKIKNKKTVIEITKSNKLI